VCQSRVWKEKVIVAVKISLEKFGMESSEELSSEVKEEKKSLEEVKEKTLMTK
jgi:hypothetical protein